MCWRIWILMVCLWMAGGALIAPPLAGAALVWQAEGEPMPEDDYWQMLDEMLAQVRQLQGAGALDESPLISMADRLQEVKQVRLASGQIVPVDNSELVERMRRKGSGWFDLYSTESQLDALVTAHRDWPRVSADPSAMETLNVVFARPEFQPRTAPASSPLQDLWDRFAEWLARQLARMGLRDVRLPNLSRVLTVVGVLALAAIVLFFVRSLRATLVSEVDLEERASDAVMSSSAALRQAQQLAAGSDYRSAVRYLYLATVLALDERGLLRFDKALTNREVLRQSSTHQRLKDELTPVVETFDKVWYGLQPISDEQYRQYELQVARAREVKPE